MLWERKIQLEKEMQARARGAHRRGACMHGPERAAGGAHTAGVHVARALKA